jgi:MFS superfamily sulfate permease-like transporter
MKTQRIQWKTLLVRTTLWLITEVVLNAVGLDNLADYGEFVFERNTIAQGAAAKPIAFLA